MQFGQLRVRCGPYNVLIPGENVGAIHPAADVGLEDASLHRARADGLTLVVDTRVLLGVAADGASRPKVNVHWHSLDGTRQVVLGVDAVGGLRYSETDDMLPLPRVHPRVRNLFKGVVPDGNGSFLLQLHQDVELTLDGNPALRRLVDAVMGALPRAVEGQRG